MLRAKSSKENIGLALVEDGHLKNKDEEKEEARHFFFLPQSAILIDLGLPSPLSWRTMITGAMTFHL